MMDFIQASHRQLSYCRKNVLGTLPHHRIVFPCLWGHHSRTDSTLDKNFESHGLPHLHRRTRNKQT